MTAFLRTSWDPATTKWEGQWVQITGQAPALDKVHCVPDVGAKLEEAFDSIRDEWWTLARRINGSSTGELSVMGSCAPYASDFGLTLAWQRVAEKFSRDETDVLIVCDDPWIFRALRTIKGIISGVPPNLFCRGLVLILRGLLSRWSVAARAASAAVRLRGLAPSAQPGVPYLLVYGHPRSSPNIDAYFGNLLGEFRNLRRIVHTDDFRVVKGLSADRRTESLHAYGSPLFALFVLPTKRWRQELDNLPAAISWLMSRAVAIEGSGGAAAMTAWQAHCQARFLKRRQPSRIVWPWENHPWERLLARASRFSGVATLGYQHADAGPHQFNMSPHACIGGLDDLPDLIILNGPAYYNHFVAWGIPARRLVVGGAFRMPVDLRQRYDPDGPIFVALSSIAEISQEMLDAILHARRPGRQFLVKAHPMYPFSFDESDGVRRTEKSFVEYRGISAMFYGTGASGIEGILAGVPTFRLLPARRTGIETMPDKLRAVPVTRDGLDAALSAPQTPPDENATEYFSAIDMEVWRSHLEPAIN